MRYTSEATMEDRPLRDVERWKDKIEVRLDNRQVFFLFFGSALVACLLFVLGVIVGKRLESRGKATAPEIEDPLALLDKVASSPRVTVETPQATPVIKAPVPAPAVARKAEPAGKSAPAAKEETPAAPQAPALAQPRTEVPRVARKAPAGAAAEPKTEAVSPADATRPRAGRYTLQIGSYPDKLEAEAFAQRFTGQTPTIVARDIPGKGLWYRVLVGDYASKDEAVNAKLAFEKQYGVIAFVAGPR